MLGYGISNVGRLAHTKAKEGNWAFVFELIEKTPNLHYQTDTSKEAPGWTFTDHAAYQSRLDILLSLRQRFNLFQQPQSSVILYHAGHQHWPWILQMLKENIVSANVVYVFADSKHATLLDIACECGLSEIAELLQDQYEAKTAQDIDEQMMKELSVNAAKRKERQAACQLENSSEISVDTVRLAAEEQTAEQLRTQLTQTLGKFSDGENVRISITPISRPLCFSGLALPVVETLADSEVGVHLLNPQDDEVVPRQMDTRVPWR